MDENNEIKVEESDEVVVQDFNEVKVEDSNEVIVQDSSEIVTQDANEINVVDNNETIKQSVNEAKTFVDNEVATQNETVVEAKETNETQPKKKKPVALIIILVLIILGVAGYFVYYKYFKSTQNITFDNYTKSYYNLETIKKEKITKEEFTSRIKKYFATCGVIDQKDDDGNAETCSNDNWYDYVAYINNGTPYYMHHASICDEDGSCTDDDEHFEVYNFSEIKNVKKIVSKVDQYNGLEFAYQLENGDVYYFTPLFDEITIDGEKHDNHLVKVDLPAKLKTFSNVDNGQISYGTEIVLLLETNEKYVMEYDYDTNKIKLTKYDEYYEKYHKFDDSIQLSADEETLKLSTEILYSEKLNNVLKNNKLISDNLDEQDYDGICPQMTIKINNKDVYFYVLQIANTKVFLYSNNDNSDGKMVEVYGLTESGDLYYAKFFAVDYEDPKNHSLELKKYSIKNVVSMALITMNDESNMLTVDEAPVVPYNYAIFKTKDGKYYTDYSYDKENRVLREVKHDGTDYGTSITSEIKEFNLDKSTLKSTNLNTIISKSKFISSNLSANTRYPSITAKNKNTKYTIKSISNPVAILYSDNDNSDSGFINAYIFDNKKNLYYASFSTKNSEDKENHDLKIYKFNVNNIVSYTLIKAKSKDEMLTEVEDVYVPYNYVIFKTKDGKYYTDYYWDKRDVNKYLRQVVQDSTSNTVDLNINITEKKESDFLAENAAEAAQYENVEAIDLDKIKEELNGKTEYSVYDCDDCDEASKPKEYAALKIDGNNVVYDVTYEDFNSEKIVNTKFIIKNIPNPKYVYGGAFGGEDSYPTEFYVQDKDGNIYIVNFTIRTNNQSPKSIIKLIK